MTASKVQPASTHTPPQTWKKVLGGVLLGLGAITFFLAQSTLWVSTTFFNEETFVDTVEQVLKTEDSRQAIASTIVHSAFQNNPVAEQLAGKQVTSLLSGFLGSDLAGQVFDRVSHRAYAYLTSSNREDIAINLVSIKDPLTALVAIVEKTGKDIQFNPAAIPDSITLVDSDSLPDLSGYIRTMLFANGLLWFAVVASFVTYGYLHRKQLVRSVYVVGWTVIAVSAAALFTGPFLPPFIASFVNLIEIRGVVEALSRALLEPFQVQLLSGTVIAAFVMLIVSLRGAIHVAIAKLVALFR